MERNNGRQIESAVGEAVAKIIMVPFNKDDFMLAANDDVRSQKSVYNSAVMKGRLHRIW